MKKVITPMIDGKRIYFSAANPDDFIEILDCFHHTLSYFQLSSGFSDPNLELVEKHYRKTLQDPNWLFWAIREKTGRESLVGISDMRLDHPKTGEATIELLLIDHRLQGRGYGHEALQAIEEMVFPKVRLIRLAVDPGNPSAKSFWERENYSMVRNPLEQDSTQQWYAKSRNWYERLRFRID